MGSCYAKKTVDFAVAQIGESCGKTNKYSAQLDEVNYFNTKKNGAADSCSIFVNACVYNSVIDPDCEDDPEGAKWTAHYMMCEPDNGSNAAAGCTQAAAYFKANDCWSSLTKDFERGDQVFFKRSDGALYHTGIIVDWDENGIYTVEGNTNGGMVAKKFYSYDDSKLAGVGKIRYDGWDIESSKPSEPASNPSNEPTWDEIFTQLARECIQGKYGNYPERKQKLNALGYGNIYSEVQKRVNMILAGTLQ